MASLAVIHELNHEDSLTCFLVVTDDVETAARQYKRKKPNEFYNNLSLDYSEKSS